MDLIAEKIVAVILWLFFNPNYAMYVVLAKKL